MNLPVLKTRLTNTLSATLGWIGRSPSHLKVLTLHAIEDGSSDIFALSKTQFRDLLGVLQAEGYTTVMAHEIAGKWPSILDRDCVVCITFDDGHVSARYAAEELVRRGMSATFFVISSNTASGVQDRFLDVGGVRALHAAGFEVGSHSHTHVVCANLGAEEAYTQIAQSKDLLQQQLGQEVTSFAYPFGGHRSFSEATRVICAAAGYAIAMTQTGLPLRPVTDLLEFPRVSVDALDCPATIRRKLAGCYELAARLRICVR